MTRFILEKVDLSKTGEAVNLIIDRCKNKEEICDFNNYVANQLEGLQIKRGRVYTLDKKGWANLNLRTLVYKLT